MEQKVYILVLFWIIRMKLTCALGLLLENVFFLSHFMGKSKFSNLYDGRFLKLIFSPQKVFLKIPFLLCMFSYVPFKTSFNAVMFTL